MKTLEQIKDEYVMDNFLASHELDTWIDFQNYFASRHPEWFEQHYDEVIKRYADECAREALRLASENVKMKLREDYMDLHMNDDWMEVDKQSILSENNLPKHR